MVEFTINIKPCEKRGIYIISNNIDERIYVGRTKNFKNRAYQHRENYLNGQGNSKVRAFIKEHPDACFEFKVVLETDDIKAKEEEYIAKYQSVENGFNILHNDDEIRQIIFLNRGLCCKYQKRKKEPVKISSFELAGLKKGYLREKGVLTYNPNRARVILKNYIVEDKKEEKKIKDKRVQTRKYKQKKYDWASVGLPDTKSLERILSNETSNNGQGVCLP